MTEKSPENIGAGQPKPESGEIQDLEVKRQATVNQLKALMREEQELIARINDKESFDRLSEINREQAILIEQLGAIEREIAAKQE